MPAGFVMTGIAEMQAKLRMIAKKSPVVFGKALYEEMKVELKEVKRRTPEDTGDLIASERLEGPFTDGNSIVVLMVAGGGRVNYAIYVHEDLEALHKVGQAKFMESVLYESRAFIGARVAKRIGVRDLV